MCLAEAPKSVEQRQTMSSRAATAKVRGKPQQATGLASAASSDCPQRLPGRAEHPGVSCRRGLPGRRFVAAWSSYHKTWRCASIRQLRTKRPESVQAMQRVEISPSAGEERGCRPDEALFAPRSARIALPWPALRPTVNCFMDRISAGAEQSSRASSSSTSMGKPIANVSEAVISPGSFRGLGFEAKEHVRPLIP